jgi:hypothetical protein
MGKGPPSKRIYNVEDIGRVPKVGDILTVWEHIIPESDDEEPPPPRRILRRLVGRARTPIGPHDWDFWSAPVPAED